MERISPISFVNKDDNNTTTQNNNTSNTDNGLFEVSFSNFVGDNTSLLNNDFIQAPADTPKPNKRKKKETKTIGGVEVVPVDGNDGELSKLQSNEPYVETYDETNDILRTTIGQIDMLSLEIKTDLDMIRSSKQLKNKYTYIPNLANTLSGLLGTKVTAIREMNSTISKSHDLELKRHKDLKLSENAVDDDKYIMDMYNAFISAPNSTGMTGLVNVPMNDMVLNNRMGNIHRVDSGQSGYESYVNNMTPVQRAMRYEQDPDVKTVVFFERSSGRKWFDIMNVRTGESVPDVPRPDPMFLEELTIDSNNGIARDANLDVNYPLIQIGDTPNNYY